MNSIKKSNTLLITIFLLTILALSACVTADPPLGFGTVHGGGKVNVLNAETGLGIGTVGEASVSVSATCHTQRDMVRAHIHWVDQNNDVNLNARLPWTTLAELNALTDGSLGDITTCEAALARVAETDISFVFALLNSQGQDSGVVAFAVGAPDDTTEDCGDEQLVGIYAEGSTEAIPGGLYRASGCLVNGNINFK